MIVKTLLLTSIAACLHAAPVGNAAAPRLIQDGLVCPQCLWIDGRIGYEGDFVFDGNLQQTATNSGCVDTFQQYTNSASATLNVCDRLDLFGVFGSSRVSADWRFKNDNAITRIQIETLYHFLWSVGARGLVAEWSQVCFSLGGSYSFCSYPPSLAAINGTPMQDLSNTGLRWRQWQADLTFSYNIELLTPYLGLKYSNTEARLGTFAEPIAPGSLGSNTFQNRNPVGLIIGCSLSNGKYFMLNIEGRFIDEDALTLSGDVRF